MQCTWTSCWDEFRRNDISTSLFQRQTETMSSQKHSRSIPFVIHMFFLSCLSCDIKLCTSCTLSVVSSFLSTSRCVRQYMIGRQPVSKAKTQNIPLRGVSLTFIGQITLCHLHSTAVEWFLKMTHMPPSCPASLAPNP